MIVPGMNLEKMKRSLRADYETELRVRIHMAQVTYQRKCLLNRKHDTDRGDIRRDAE